jgi:hypothetical protein
MRALILVVALAGLLPAQVVQFKGTADNKTDNMHALQEQYTKAAKAGKTFLIPAGTYLVKTAPSVTLSLQSHSEIRIAKGATIHWVGPVGNNGDGPDNNHDLIYIAPGSEWIHIQIDGKITGDNVNGQGGTPSMNQSAAIVVFPNNPNWAHDITIDGSGSIENVYGFDVHAFGYNIAMRNLTIKRSGKGTNINADNSEQTGLYLYKSFGIETAANAAHIHHNRFDSSGGISLGGAGGTCYGDIVDHNTFTNMVATNVSVADCPVGAIIDSNSFEVLSGGNGYDSAVQVHDGVFSYVANLVVSNNTITCDGGFSAFYTSGKTVMGSVFLNNNMITPSGGTVCPYGILDETTGGMDVVIGGTYQGGLADIGINAANTVVLAINPRLIGTGYTPPMNDWGSFGHFDSRSTFIAPNWPTSH